MLGFDTLYEAEIDPVQWTEAVGSDRVLVTRIRALRTGSAGRKVLFIRSNDHHEQLREVIHQLHIQRDELRPFSRCLLCNTVIEAVQKEMVHGLVPDYVWETQDTFQQCRLCQKIYWSGSHIHRSRDRIDNIFDPEK